MFEQFTRLVMSRQSYREFNDKPLEDDKIEKIIKLALNAPSACNSQPWKIIVVKDEERRKKVAKSLQNNGANKFTDQAKAFLVITETDATLKESVSTRFNRNHFVKYDIGELVAYLTLGAESMGIGTCILGWINQKELKEAADIENGEICNIVIALGYSDSPTREKTRKKYEKLVRVL